MPVEGCGCVCVRVVPDNCTALFPLQHYPFLDQLGFGFNALLVERIVLGWSKDRFLHRDVFEQNRTVLSFEMGSIGDQGVS